MVIIIKKTLSAFAEKHPEAAVPLNNWYNMAKIANWSKLSDIKSVFNNVDYV
jgi:mRNA interferase HigB